MQIAFRQGIVKTVPDFLQTTGNTVSLVIHEPGYVLASIADGDTNYLIAERTSIPSAWAGPFQPGVDYWLYWDLHPLTGEKTYGHTTLAPIQSSIPPKDPQNDQHWFDLTTSTMKVWNTIVSRWVKKIRLFSARLVGGSALVSVSIQSPAFEGTQIGSFTYTPAAAGSLIFDSEGKALRKGNGTFFTTEDVGVTGITAASRVKLNAVVREGEANVNMAKLTLVVFTDFTHISPATPAVFTLSKQVGIIEEDVVVGGYVNIVTDGIITSVDWDWSQQAVDTPLFVGHGGVLTTVPVAPAFDPVAYVIGVHSIRIGGDRAAISDNLAISNLQLTKLNKAGDTMTGTLVLSGDPTSALHAATKQYVDGVLPDMTTVVAKSGSTMTGPLVLSGDPTLPLHAATKQYVDAKSATTVDTIAFGATISIDVSQTRYAVLSVSSNTTLTFTNPPAVGTVGELTLELPAIQAGSVITWPNSVYWPGGTAPAVGTLTNAIFEFYTRDGGVSWNGFLVASNMATVV